ncbi:MAG: hypothetical protein VYE68_09565 [Acidobacteriota bacterium]|nr:hypothetical protein [Acidobacteriota bacterium]
MRVRSSAPTRIDLAGGTLDIWPLYLFHPPAQTVNVAIDLRATCHLAPCPAGRVEILSQDTGMSLVADTWDKLPTDGDNRLLSHIARFFQVPSVSITTHAASPLGAGIAGSSALNIAVCAALARWTGRIYSDTQLLTLAMNLEARTLGIPTGVQDYRPALHGGIAAIELDPVEIRRVPIDVDPKDLERRLMLAYSGDSRSSGLNNWDITRRHIEGDPLVTTHLRCIGEIATAAREALSRRDWPGLAHQISLEWEERKALAPGVTTPAIEQLLAHGTEAGALAGKVCGAGGGGCVFFLVDPGHRDPVGRAITEAGGRLLDCQIDQDGLRVDVTP